MKNKKGRIFAIAASVSALIILAVILIQTLTPGVLWCLTPKAKAKDGVIEKISGIEHISEVPQGEIKYLINNNVTLKSDSSKGDFMLENPQACEYALQLSVYEIVGDNGEENILYTSPMIAPGQYLYEDKLDKKLPSGEYNCVYFVRAFSDGEYAGERSGDMTVTVLK